MLSSLLLLPSLLLSSLLSLAFLMLAFLFTGISAGAFPAVAGVSDSVAIPPPCCRWPILQASLLLGPLLLKASLAWCYFFTPVRWRNLLLLGVARLRYIGLKLSDCKFSFFRIGILNIGVATS